MSIEMIYAVSENGVIGLDNALPWRLKGELPYFKEKTMGKTLACGRKTFKSLGSKPLPNRDIIILTSNYSLRVNSGQGDERVILVNSLGKLLRAAEHFSGNLCVIGGAQLYSEFLKKPEMGLDRVYRTVVHGDLDGDTYFKHNPQDFGFSLVSSKEGLGKKDPDNKYDFTFEVWEKT